MISGDFSQLVYSIRQDITFKLFTEGVVQNTDGTIAYNLMQNDTVTRKVTVDTSAPVIKSITLTPNPVDCGKTFIIAVEITD